MHLKWLTITGKSWFQHSELSLKFSFLTFLNNSFINYFILMLPRMKSELILTWSRRRRTGSVLSGDFFAASQNCFWEAYLWHGLIRGQLVASASDPEFWFSGLSGWNGGGEAFQYLFIGQIMKRQSLNFLGMFVKSPASGHTTHRSSTKLYKGKIVRSFSGKKKSN